MHVARIPLGAVRRALAASMTEIWFCQFDGVERHCSSVGRRFVAHGIHYPTIAQSGR